MDLPRRLGPVELISRIGAGGMGIVYRGVQDGVPVAVKVIRAELADDEEFRARFRREVVLMRRVRGACTARVLSADPDADQPYLVTEFLPGPSLAEHVRRHGPMPPATVRMLAVGLAEALLAIHGVGVVHRDLKPSNVLLTPAGPKVIDFGIAQAADVTVLTRTGTAIGSPGYMSPEQLAGRSVGPSNDVFAWACTVAFAATGRPPFGEGPSEAVLFRVRHDPPDLTGVPGDLTELLTRALVKEPERRAGIGVLLTELLASTAEDGEAGTAGEDLTAVVTRLIAEGWSVRAEDGRLVPSAMPVVPVVPVDASGPGVSPPGSPSLFGSSSPFRSSSPPGPASRGDPGESPRRPHWPHRPRWLAVGAVGAVLIVLLVVGLVRLTVWDQPGAGASSAAGSSPSAGRSATTPDNPTTTGSGSSGPSTAGPSPGPSAGAGGVTADRLSPGARLFLDVMPAGAKPWMWDVRNLMSDATEGPAFQAPLLGAWWSLADWCAAEKKGRTGKCYDLAAENVVQWFGYDPRRINSETWVGAGAIAGTVADGYDVTQADLGLTGRSGLVTKLFAGRPGMDVLCEPSCAARLDH